MHPLAGQGIQVDRGRGHQRLALPGFHLGDPPLVQRDAANQLDIVVAHAHDPATGLAHGRKGFGQQGVQGFALREPAPELSGLALQLGIGEIAKRLLKFIDTLDNLAHPLDFSGIFTSENFRCKLCEHRPLLL